ncbi:MAG: SDR family oxidoreductase [Anaerolineae bacterium]|nr:SDR family oxidoreductase [Anaerolineae bacterium]
MGTESGLDGIKRLFDLEGKVAVITGASGALGRAVSLGLAAHGVDIVACSNELERLDELAQEIRETTGRRALPIFCDVTDTKSVDQMVSRALAEFGKIDILFTAAGMAYRERLVTMGVDDWQKVMDVNVKGTLICCRAVAREMIRLSIAGSIITVGSVRGFHAHKDGYTAYGTSKAAVHYLTKQMAFEWAENNIRVNCIAPCVFWSPLTAPILSDEESYHKYTSRIPMGRAAKPEDFIGATVFLASDASEMVTAHILSVDGGTAGG